MFSLDMTGEDTAKTGGTFLIEKQADPSAVWTRPSDPHSEWGAGEVKAESLKGSLLNDVHLAVSLRRAKDTKWVVRTNPYEGGSDHTAFGDAGIPSVLNWHFTDRYYHTNLDRPDKTSALEMVNVGVAVATSAWFLASADERDANAVVDLLTASADDAARARAAPGRSTRGGRGRPCEGRADGSRRGRSLAAMVQRGVGQRSRAPGPRAVRRARRPRRPGSGAPGSGSLNRRNSERESGT